MSPVLLYKQRSRKLPIDISQTWLILRQQGSARAALLNGDKESCVSILVGGILNSPADSESPFPCLTCFHIA